MADPAATETDPKSPHLSTSSDSSNNHNDANNDDGSSDPTEFLMTYLTSTRKIDIVHSTLFNSLARQGWTQRVRSLAFELIRSRTCTRFEQVVDHILDVAAASPPDEPAGENGTKEGEGEGKGENGVNGSIQDRKRKREGDAETSISKPVANGADPNTGPNKKRAKQGSSNSKAQTPSNNTPDQKKPPTGGPATAATTTNGHQEPTTTQSSSSTDANANSYYNLDIDVRIPPTVVSQGARFLRNTMNDLYVWGGVEGDEELFLTNGRRSSSVGDEGGDADADADADTDADAEHDTSVTGEKANGAADATTRGETSETAAAAATAEDAGTAETDETKKKKKGKEKEGVGGKT